VFEGIKTYELPNKGDQKKICALCHEPLITYTICDDCQQYFCRKHRPLFSEHWTCPLCIEKRQNYLNQNNFSALLKASKIEEFMKKIF
jgi:hypothetical protein